MAGNAMHAVHEQEIRAMLDDYRAALEAKDTERVVAHFTDDSVMMVLSPPLQFGAGSGPGRAGVEEWFASFADGIGYEVRDVRVVAGDDVAFCHYLVHLTGRRTDGTTTDLWFRETLGLRREHSVWRVAHQHQSVPFHMDGSNRAAVDLTP